MKIKPLHTIAGILLSVLVVPSLFGQTPPTNDTCMYPVTLTNGITFSQDITQATEPGDAAYPGDCGAGVGHGVWFTLTTTTNERVMINTAGSNCCGRTCSATPASFAWPP